MTTENQIRPHPLEGSALRVPSLNTSVYSGSIRDQN
jgi:hypothetical protein